MSEDGAGPSSSRKLVRPGMPASATRPLLKTTTSESNQTNGTGSTMPETLLKKLSATIASPSLPMRVGRLASFKQERDLTLGGTKPPLANGNQAKPKKVFTPTIPARREKTKETEKDHDGQQNSKRGPPATRQPRGHAQQGSRGRGRGRGQQPQVIQVQGGVFAEGVAEGSIRRFQSRGSYGQDDNTPSQMAKPTLNLNNTKIDKAEEDRKLSELMRDNFVDDGYQDEEQFAPIQLPKIESAKLLKAETMEVEPLQVKTDSEQIDGGVKIKQEILDDEHSEVAAEQKGNLKTSAIKAPAQTDIAELFTNQKTDFILLQLPAVLPGLKADKDKPKVIKQEPGTTATGAETKASPVAPEESCTLKTLPEGRLGTLQVLKSGKVRMKLGNHLFDVDCGTPLTFLEELVTTQLDDESRSGEMTNLGKIKNHVICSPEWISLLADSLK